MKTKTVTAIIGDLTIEAIMNRRNNLTIRGYVGKTQVMFITTSITAANGGQLVEVADDCIWIGQTCIEHAELANWLATELEQNP